MLVSPSENCTEDNQGQSGCDMPWNSEFRTYILGGFKKAGCSLVWKESCLTIVEDGQRFPLKEAVQCNHYYTGKSGKWELKM